MHDLTIRQATPNDANLVAEFNIALASETEDLRLEVPVVNAGVAAILSDSSKGLYFVAESGQQMVGQVMITYEWSDWRNGNIWWLQSVYVRPSWRGKGVFRKLFEHVRTCAQTSPDVRGIRLYMHNGNAQARNVYGKLGFENTSYEVFELPIKGLIES